MQCKKNIYATVSKPTRLCVADEVTEMLNLTKEADWEVKYPVGRTEICVTKAKISHK